MIQVLVLNKEIKNKIPEKIERNLQWYDHIKKKMLNFKGGKLAFSYKYDEELGRNRMMPEVEDEYSMRIIKNRDSELTKKWFNNYSNYNNVNAEIIEENNKGIIFGIEQEDVDSFLYDLERNNFQFDIV